MHVKRFVALPGADHPKARVDALVQALDEHVARLAAQRLGLLLLWLFLHLGDLESAGVEPSEVREAASVQADVSTVVKNTILVAQAVSKYTAEI